MTLDLRTLPSLRFWGLAITVGALFLMGGSSRIDVQSLAILSPGIILSCGFAALTIGYEHLRRGKWLLSGIAVMFILVAGYLAPIPLSLANFSRVALDAAAIYEATEISRASHQLAAERSAALQSLLFLFAPMSVTLFAIQLKQNELKLTLLIVLAVGLLSAAVGVLQLTGSGEGVLFFYEISSYGKAVGLFANRNHAAVFLASLFPIAAIIAKSPASGGGASKALRLIAIVVATILIPLILITGSRAGMFAALIGLIGCVPLYLFNPRPYDKPKRMGLVRLMLPAFVLLCLVTATMLFSRAEALERLFEEVGTAKDRADFWSSSIQMTKGYFPFGSGPGSFVSIFGKDEPDALLDGLYLNRLHNDWLETALSFGAPGALVMLSVAIYYIRRSFVLWMRMDGECWAVAIGRTASIILVILAIASISDYPLRTPAFAGFAALLLVWFTHARGGPSVCDGRLRR